MSNQTLTFLVGIVLVGMASLFVVNYMPGMQTLEPETFIGYNDIRGMAVYYNNKAYTLNFDQQNGTASALNTARSITREALQNRENGSVRDIQKIEIYRFDNLSPIEITPIRYFDNNLVFSAPQWGEGYFVENSQGKLRKLLSQTYTH